ncbi:18 kDa heat shock protein [Stieleria bergensis]|uniref:18 kDa heat shock protein n=1 Tax=Stieleria bergensis TaxID=2528025 RepID=A0A517T175_9BACT|nr:18 kDa heat shock protein [Planctomycetes bacterium SV_7m_r]
MRMVFPTKRPARLMDELATDVGTFVESFFGDLGQGSSQHQRSGSQHQRMSAPMDVHESADAFRLSLDVPGVKLGDIEIDVHDNVLRIAGTRHWQTDSVTEPPDAEGAKSSNAEHAEGDVAQAGQPAAEPTMKRLASERSFGGFERKLKFRTALEADQVRAELSDGVLTIHLPKADPQRGRRRVEVQKVS